MMLTANQPDQPDKPFPKSPTIIDSILREYPQFEKERQNIFYIHSIYQLIAELEITLDKLGLKVFLLLDDFQLVYERAK
jgi:hypothetical protein